jgi:hypothetical protein
MNHFPAETWHEKFLALGLFVTVLAAILSTFLIFN